MKMYLISDNVDTLTGMRLAGVDGIVVHEREELREALEYAFTFGPKVLVEHAMHAVEEYHVDRFAIAGGVASNSALRLAMKDACEKRGVRFYYPSPVYCTDNAAMIGAAAYYEYINGTRHGWDLNAVPNLKTGGKIDGRWEG